MKKEIKIIIPEDYPNRTIPPKEWEKELDKEFGDLLVIDEYHEGKYKKLRKYAIWIGMIGFIRQLLKSEKEKWVEEGIKIHKIGMEDGVRLFKKDLLKKMPKEMEGYPYLTGYENKMVSSDMGKYGKDCHNALLREIKNIISNLK